MSATAYINNGSFSSFGVETLHSSPSTCSRNFSNSSTYRRLRNSRHLHNQHNTNVFNMSKADEIFGPTGQTSEPSQPNLSPSPSPEPKRSRSPFSNMFRRGSASSQTSNLDAPATASPSSSTGFSLRRTLSGRSSRGQDSSSSQRQSLAPSSSLAPGTSTERSSSPPPSYIDSVQPPAVGRAGADGPDDDQYAFLHEFNTIFLIDDSASMHDENRWGETQQAIRAILPVCMKYDDDGIDVYFFNHRSRFGSERSRGAAAEGYLNIKDPKVIENMFRGIRPSGRTPTGKSLDRILRPYLDHYAAKVKVTKDVDCVSPINIIVITDGEADDDPESIIAAAARRLDNLHAPPHQIGIQFFQVGTNPDAKTALHELDDELGQRHGIRDMVDTSTFDDTKGRAGPKLTSDGILKVVLGSVKRKLDRKVVIRVDAPQS